MNTHPTLSQFTRTWMAKDEEIKALIDAYWAGQLGDVGFAEASFKIGMTASETGQVMFDVRKEDGTL